MGFWKEGSWNLYCIYTMLLSFSFREKRGPCYKREFPTPQHDLADIGPADVYVFDDNNDIQREFHITTPLGFDTKYPRVAKTLKTVILSLACHT